MEKKTWEVPELQEIDVRMTLGGYGNSYNEKNDFAAGYDAYPEGTYEYNMYMAASAS